MRMALVFVAVMLVVSSASAVAVMFDLQPVLSTTVTTTSTNTTMPTVTTTTTISTISSGGGQGTVNGTISIGPLQPVCLANSSVGQAPSSIASIQAVITPRYGSVMHVPTNWAVYARCEAVGRFQATLEPGVYTLNLSSCDFMGCTSSLPRAFTILDGEVTTIGVSIDTGIR